MSDTYAEVQRTTSFESPETMCSICFDAVAGHVYRSTAKLICGHDFHLDCIGSAFNVKGAMQCPNCRNVEMGRWLYASGPPCSDPEIVMEDWIPHEEQYALAHPETPFSFHWCPFSGLPRAHTVFEVLDSSQPAYHNLPRPASSVPQSYLAYVIPIPPASPSVTNVTIENHNYSYQSNGVSNPNNNMQYPNGVHNPQLLPANNAYPNSIDQAPVAPVTHRSMREIDTMTRSGSYMQSSLHGYSSQSRGMLQSSQAIHYPHQQTTPVGMSTTTISGPAIFHGRSTLPPPPPPVPTYSASTQNGTFYIYPPQGSSILTSHQTESSFPNVAGSDSNRTGSFWHGQWP